MEKGTRLLMTSQSMVDENEAGGRCVVEQGVNAVPCDQIWCFHGNRNWPEVKEVLPGVDWGRMDAERK